MKTEPVPADSIPAPDKRTIYPPPFSAQVKGRTKRKLGDYFGLTNFGVNLTELAPGPVSALLHSHSKQDEFIYILERKPTLILGEEEYILGLGDRSEGDEVEYPNDDLKAVQLTDGKWQLTHKDDRPY